MTYTKPDPELLKKFEGCSFQNMMKRALLIDRRTKIINQGRKKKEQKS